MLVSELIKQLQEVMEKEGDNPVWVDVKDSDEFVDIQEVVGKYHSLNTNSSNGTRASRIFICCEPER